VYTLAPSTFRPQCRVRSRTTTARIRVLVGVVATAGWQGGGAPGSGHGWSPGGGSTTWGGVGKGQDGAEPPRSHRGRREPVVPRPWWSVWATQRRLRRTLPSAPTRRHTDVSSDGVQYSGAAARVTVVSRPLPAAPEKNLSPTDSGTTPPDSVWLTTHTSRMPDQHNEVPQLGVRPTTSPEAPIRAPPPAAPAPRAPPPPPLRLRSQPPCRTGPRTRRPRRSPPSWGARRRRRHALRLPRPAFTAPMYVFRQSPRPAIGRQPSDHRRRRRDGVKPIGRRRSATTCTGDAAASIDRRSAALPTKRNPATGAAAS